MVVISYSTLRKFGEAHTDAMDSLNAWYIILQKGNFGNFNQLRLVFNSVDNVGNDRYVFNIKGNKYRVVVLILFRIRTVFILFVGTHSEYDKIDAATLRLK